jgi:hypothetical protein
MERQTVCIRGKHRAARRYVRGILYEARMKEQVDWNLKDAIISQHRRVVDNSSQLTVSQ